MIFQRLLVNGEAEPFCRHAVAVVDINHVIDGLEGLADAGGGRASGRGVGAVDFGKQGREHRRPRRDLNHLERGMRRQRQVGEALANIQRDGVTRPFAVVLGRQIDGEVAHLRLAAQIIVANEPVEVERRGGARIGLDRDQFRQVGDAVGCGLQHTVGLLDG